MLPNFFKSLVSWDKQQILVTVLNNPMYPRGHKGFYLLVFPSGSQKKELKVFMAPFPNETQCLFSQHNQVKEMQSIKVGIIF